jgi:hypothetical protein
MSRVLTNPERERTGRVKGGREREREWICQSTQMGKMLTAGGPEVYESFIFSLIWK